MGGSLKKLSIKSQAMHVAAFLCLALILIFNTIHVLHVHAAGSKSDNDCMICHAAKTTVAVSEINIVQPFLITAYVVAPQPIFAITRTEQVHSIRPPPVSSSLQ